MREDVIAYEFIACTYCLLIGVTRLYKGFNRVIFLPNEYVIYLYLLLFKNQREAKHYKTILMKPKQRLMMGISGLLASFLMLLLLLQELKVL